MVPGCAIVSGPCSRVALRAGKSRSGQHKGTQIGLKPKQAFIGGACIFHSEHIVNFAVVSLASFNAVNHIEWHCLGWVAKYRGLIHIVPESPQPVAHEICVQRAPPASDLLAGEIGKDAVARPHLAHVN